MPTLADLARVATGDLEELARAREKMGDLLDGVRNEPPRGLERSGRSLTAEELKDLRFELITLRIDSLG